MNKRITRKGLRARKMLCGIGMLFGLGTVAANLTIWPARSTASLVNAGSQISTLTNTYLSSLTTTQLSVSLLAATSTNAAHWSNLPATPANGGTNMLRNGVAYSVLTTAQRAAFINVAKTALGENGYARFTNVRASDYFLGTFSSSINGSTGVNTDTTNYSGDYEYIAAVGTPSSTASWLLQIGGHHNAHNYTYNTSGGLVSCTPYFLGVEPHSGFTYNGTAYPGVLNSQHDSMYTLINSLTTAQLTSAKLTSNYSDVSLGPGEDARSNFPTGTTGRGILASSLSTTTQAYILAAINAWTKDCPLASTYNTLYTNELASTYVAYSGTTAEATQGDYVRIDGPHVWIEFICQNGVVVSGQIHYHSIWRDRLTDYNAVYFN